MTDAERQELFARLGRLERSAWRWRVFASVLAVFFLLLLSLGLVSFVTFRNEAVIRQRLAVEQAERARAVAVQEAVRALEAERRAREAEAEARRRADERGAPKHMPRADDGAP